jgi:hypothetical protein
VIRTAIIGVLLCLPLAAAAQDGHRQAVLRLAALSAAIAEEARALPDKGLFAVERGSRMPEADCGEFFQDLVLLRNVAVVDRLDPAFQEWRDGDRRHVRGYVVVRWRGRQELRVRVQAPGVHHVETAAAEPLCAVRAVRGSEPGEWTAKLAPMLIDLPGETRKPPRVFPVDVERAPSARVLDPH